MKQIVIALFFLNLPFLMHSQDSELGNWLIYLGNKKINEKWNWHHEIQHRNYNALGDLEQLLLRTGIGFNLTENNNNILLGYGYILSENYLPNADEKTSVEEHRIFQQFITRQKIDRVSVQHRYRFEQRFIEENFKLRFRYFLALNIGINRATLAANTFYVSLYNEIFLNTEGRVFDRNRLYGGLGFALNENIRFELGYMNQFFEIGGRDQINVFGFVNF